MIEINITPEHISEAEQLYEFGSLNNSITKGNSNIFGALGEVIIKDYFNAPIVGHHDYDLIIDRYKIHVKTKRSNYPPQPDELCSVAAYNIRQQCDFYFFVRVLQDKTKAWLLGYLSKKDFYTKAEFNLKGEQCKVSRHGWTYRADCFNIAIKDLNKFK